MAGGMKGMMGKLGENTESAQTQKGKEIKKGKRRETVWSFDSPSPLNIAHV